jgi:hypothetical protein
MAPEAKNISKTINLYVENQQMCKKIRRIAL